MEHIPPLDRRPYHAYSREYLDRSLLRPHLTGITISGTIGAGLFISAGEIIAVSGSVGAIFSYLVAGLVVASTMYCLSEMVTARPLTGALITFPHHFVEPALGFAVATVYWYTPHLI